MWMCHLCLVIPDTHVPLGLGAITPPHRLNPDFLRARTLVLPRSSNKTSLTIPSRRPRIHRPGTRPADAQNRRVLYEFHNRPPWPVMSSHTSPAPLGPPSKHTARRIQPFFLLRPYFQLVCLFSALKSARYTHTLGLKVCGWIFL